MQVTKGMAERFPDFTILAPVVQMLDIDQLVLLVFIRWIVIYPVDSAIHRSNNWGQEIQQLKENSQN